METTEIRSLNLIVGKLSHLVGELPVKRIGKSSVIFNPDARSLVRESAKLLGKAFTLLRGNLSEEQRGKIYSMTPEEKATMDEFIHLSTKFKRKSA